MRLLLAMLLGRLAGRLSRLLGRGGSAIPGLVAEKVDPRVVEKLAARLRDGVVVVTGTNGKTTTSKMLATILAADGRDVITNRTGSNLVRGIATLLIEVATLRGGMRGDLAVFEVDEAALRVLAPRLRPRFVVVTNLARDQLDRFGELVTTAGHIASALEHADGAVLNADDDMVAGLAGDHDVRWFGASSEIAAAMPSDASLYGGSDAGGHGGPLDVRLAAAEPRGDGIAISVETQDGSADVVLQVPGPYNGYNAAAAIAAARRLGVGLPMCVAALEWMPPAFGRAQVIAFRGRRVKLLLVKNPAGFNQAIRLLTAQPEGVPVLVAINDNDADGRDVSWLWDARVEDLAGSALRFGTSGIRAHDMALRFKYAGIEAWAEPDFRAALGRIVDAAGEGEDVFVVPTYTAMLGFLDLLLPDSSRREAWT
jgi:UDP-N-acetylmuramyl tripeptide synthase